MKPFVESGDVVESFVKPFVDYFMSVARCDSRCVAFADYVLDNCIVGDAKFHCPYNEQFYTHQPCVYCFTEVVNNIRNTTYIRMRKLSVNAHLQN